MIALLPTLISAPLWINGYRTAWSEDKMPVSEMMLAPLTHLTYFSILPTPTGEIDPKTNGVAESGVSATVSAVHSAGKRLMICIGGADSGKVFRPAISRENRIRLVKNLVDWTAKHGFDGIDLDMEPIEKEDAANFQAFVRNLHSVMRSRNPEWLLTAAAGADEVSIYPPIASDFDQINVMTYDMSGAWEGWDSWFNSPLYNAGQALHSTGAPLPSVELAVQKWAAAGLPKSKLGIGIPFYGDVWHGVSAPAQNAKGMTSAELDYSGIIDQWYKPERYRWDDKAHASYLTIQASDSKSQAFVSYDDARMVAEKIAYVKAQGLGGAIIWQISGDYMPALPAGKRHPLMQAISDAVGR